MALQSLYLGELPSVVDNTLHREPVENIGIVPMSKKIFRSERRLSLNELGSALLCTQQFWTQYDCSLLQRQQLRFDVVQLCLCFLQQLTNIHEIWCWRAVIVGEKNAELGLYKMGEWVNEMFCRLRPFIAWLMY